MVNASGAQQCPSSKIQILENQAKNARKENHASTLANGLVLAQEVTRTPQKSTQDLTIIDDNWFSSPFYWHKTRVGWHAFLYSQRKAAVC